MGSRGPQESALLALPSLRVAYIAGRTVPAAASAQIIAEKLLQSAQLGARTHQWLAFREAAQARAPRPKCSRACRRKCVRCWSSTTPQRRAATPRRTRTSGVRTRRFECSVRARCVLFVPLYQHVSHVSVEFHSVCMDFWTGAHGPYNPRVLMSV